MNTPTTYDVAIRLSPSAFLVSKGAAYRSGYQTSVLVKDEEVLTLSAKQFVDQPLKSMGALVLAIAGAMPDGSVADLVNGGIKIAFPNGAVLRGWEDCVAVQCADGEEFAWCVEEWSIAPVETELVIGAFINYLAHAVTEAALV